MPRSLLFLGLLVSTVAGAAWCSLAATGSPRLADVAAAAGAGGREKPGSGESPVGAAQATHAALAAAAPIQLTASDGTGLALVALEANGVVEPPLAFTELRLTFENPRDARIEGRFRIALPAGAALSRFAMKAFSGWQEGEVVERQRARLAYEDFLHRRQDPALLEQEAGNEFSARVFPIPARGRKELIVSYSQPLTRADQPYVIPLQGLSAIGRLDLRVLLGERPAAGAGASSLGGEVSDRRVVELHQRDWTPDRDFEVGQESFQRRDGLRHENLAVVRVAAPVEAVRQEVGGLYVLVDSSASRALGYGEQVQRLAELIDALRQQGDPARRLGIAAFDQEVAPIFEGQLGEIGAADVRRLLSRRPLGASDLHRALTWLGGRLGRNGNRQVARVLLITDGVATAGETEPRALAAAVKALGAAGVERLDVLAVGGLRDDAALRELTTGNLAHDGARIEGAASGTEILRRLTLACRSGIAVAVEGAAWVWPEALDGMQPGDQALVYADLPRERPFRLSLDGRAVALDGGLVPAERPLLERAWAQARIERLLHLRESALAGDDDLRRALGLEIVELSVRHRVVSPLTAMLVLETELDYARFGLDRRALADVLTVGAGGLEVIDRSRSSLPPAMALEPDTGRASSIAPRDAAVGRRGLAKSAEAATAAAELGAGAWLEESPAVEGGVPAPAAGGVPGAAGDLPGSVYGNVSGGVAGGVPGGVVGGVPAGVPGSAAAGSGPAYEPVQPTVLPSPSAPAPPPAPRPVPRRMAAPPDAAARSAAPATTAAPDEAESSPASRGGAPRPEVVDDGITADLGELKRQRVAPYAGPFAEVMLDLAAGRVAKARARAEAWSAEAPGDVMALVALGEAWEAAGEKAAAARAYGSLIDLFPSRADLRRLAAERLERLGDAGLELAIDSYRKAVEQRPDHPSGHRLLAWALWRAGRFAGAFEALAKGLEQRYPSGRFPGVDRVLKEDLGLLAAAWLRAEPGRRQEVVERLDAHGAELATGPSLRFVLSWETDANDVDLHVYDRSGGHAYYNQRELPSGGELFADVTTGYGPECFAVRAPAGERAAPYRLWVHYYSRGPMGYGMGTVQVVTHHGAGRLAVEPRPFVVMADDAMLDLGVVAEGGKGSRAGRHAGPAPGRKR